jgi:hypothetical protein
MGWRVTDQERHAPQFLGKLVSRNGAVGTWQITHQGGDDGRFIELDDASRMFPPKGEVIDQHPTVLKLAIGALCLLDLRQESRGRRVAPKLAAPPIKLMPLIDLSGSESLDAARRALCSGPERFGAVNGENVVALPGSLLFIGVFSGTEGGLFLETPQGRVYPVRPRVEDASLLVRDGLEFRAFFASEMAAPIGTFSWQDDLAVVEGMASVLAKSDAVPSLQASLETVRNALSGLPDIVSRELLENGRWSRIEDALLSRQELVRSIADALADRGEFARFRKSLIERIEQSERERAGERLMKKLALEWAEDLRAKRDAVEKRLMQQIAEKEERDSRELQARLESMVAAAETEAAKRIEEVAAKAAEEEGAIRARLTPLQEEAAAHTTEAAAIQAEVVRLRDMRADLTAQVKVLDLAAQSSKPALKRPSYGFGFQDKHEATGLPPEQWRDAVGGLLAPAGRDAVFKLAALLAAGEVVGVTGHDGADLLQLYAHLTTARRLAFIDLDPTVISFEDLLSRHPGHAPSRFGTLIEHLEAQTERRPALAIFRGVQDSAIQHWLPALVQAAPGLSKTAGLQIVLLLDAPTAKRINGLALLAADAAMTAETRLGLLLKPPAPSWIAMPTSDEQALARTLVAQLLPKSIDSAERLSAIAVSAKALMPNEQISDALRTAAHDIDTPLSVAPVEAIDD